MLRIVTGDATQPLGSDPRVIVHVCNDEGGWGRGFVVALSARWKIPEAAYRSWFKKGEAGGFALGSVDFVEVEPSLWVANLIGQHKTRSIKGVPPVRYEAIRLGLEVIRRFCEENQASVHMPRIGCGLAGGSWEKVESLIRDELIGYDIDVTVYDLPTD